MASSNAPSSALSAREGFLGRIRKKIKTTALPHRTASPAHSALGGTDPSLHSTSAVQPKLENPASLWDKAYEAVREDDPELVRKYENRIASFLGESAINASNKEQLNRVIALGLKQTEQRFRLGGYTIQEGLAKAAEIAEWAKEWIESAVQASPEASTAWAIISLGLPFLTNPATAQKDCEEGFSYTISRMEYYLALEAPILNLGQHIEATIIDFYKKVLGFQIKSVLRLYQKSIARFGHDILQTNDWKGLLKALKAAEEQLYRDVLQSSSLSSQQRFFELAHSAVKNDEKMQLLLDSILDQLEVQKDIRDHTKTTAEYQAETQDARVAEEKNKCLQLFRLSVKASDRDESYEVFKKRNAQRVKDTCLWFLNHSNFKLWQQAKSGPLLVTADPGCGKSVLATYLIDEILTQPVCYFFFKDQVQARSNQALCALLHQLLSRTPELLELVLPTYRKNGEALVNNVTLLWSLLCRIIDHSIPVTIVLDGLDEWADEDRRDLMVDLRSYLSKTGAKFLLLSRPYEQVTSELRLLIQDFPNIRIPGEDLSKEISPEIDLVIRARVSHLAAEMRLNDQMKTYIEQQLLKAPQRTYLWITLVLDYLKKDFKRTPKGFDLHLTQLPLVSNNIYEATLERCNSGIDPATTRIIFSILLAAKDVLSIVELQVATEFGQTADLESLPDLQFEDLQDFERLLRQRCGLLVTVLDSNVYFLHQTVRDFLLGSGNPNGWEGSFTPTQANNDLAEICVDYLSYMSRGFGGDPESWLLSRTVISGFAIYAIRHWAEHCRDYDPSSDRASIFHRKASELCSPQLVFSWPSLVSRGHVRYNRKTDDTTRLMIAAMLGLSDLISFCLQHADVNQQDFQGFTALHYAIEQGYSKTAEALLDLGASIDIPDWLERKTALEAAVKRNALSLVMRMVQINGLNLQDARGYTALHYAVVSSDEIAMALLDHGAAADIQTYDYNEAALHLAIRRLAEKQDTSGIDVVIRLINMSTNLELKGKGSQTALILATRESKMQEYSYHWYEKVVSELLRCGADVNARADRRQTPLHIAATSQFTGITTLLLNKGADVDARKRYGETPFHVAAKYGSVELIHLLRSHHDCSELIEADSLSLLTYAMAAMDSEKFDYLINIGCRAKETDSSGRTVLHRLFSVRGHDIVVEKARDTFEKMLLTVLSYGLDLNSTDAEGLTPLMSLLLLCRRRPTLRDDKPGGTIDTMVKAFLNAGADLTIKSMEGNTAWWYAWTAGMRNMSILLKEEENRQRAQLNVEEDVSDLPAHDQSTLQQPASGIGTRGNEHKRKWVQEESDVNKGTM